MIILGCQQTTDESPANDYELVLDGDIYVEQFDSTNTDENRYTENNQAYALGNRYTFDYYYEDQDGNRFKFKPNDGSDTLSYEEGEKAWSFVPLDQMTDNTVNHVVIKVKFGLEPLIQYVPDYNQTIISFSYPMIDGESKFSSASGVIENEKNVWMHPPRDRLFRILEINPFPFIQAPYEIGNQWKWDLSIGSSWGDERWRTWSGTKTHQYRYEITDRTKIETPAGEFDCWVIESDAYGNIGNSHLTAYFDPFIGFVKLDYTNVDSTKLILDLIEFSSNQ